MAIKNTYNLKPISYFRRLIYIVEFNEPYNNTEREVIYLKKKM